MYVCVYTCICVVCASVCSACLLMHVRVLLCVYMYVCVYHCACVRVRVCTCETTSCSEALTLAQLASCASMRHSRVSYNTRFLGVLAYGSACTHSVEVDNTCRHCTMRELTHELTFEHHACMHFPIGPSAESVTHGTYSDVANVMQHCTKSLRLFSTMEHLVKTSTEAFHF